jgi:uncharacterized protein (DUF697 family)
VRTSKIRRGFHRLGLVLAALLIVVFAIDRIINHGGSVSIDAMMTAATAAGALYGMCWALGWVIAGYMGDNE